MIFFQKIKKISLELSHIFGFGYFFLRAHLFLGLDYYRIFFQEQRPPSYNRISLDESEVISPKPTIPPVQIPPILEEKRNQRRQQLNEILQKIRPENGASPQTPTIHHSSSNGLAKNDVRKKWFF